MSDIPNKPPMAEIRRVEPNYPNRVYRTVEQAKDPSHPEKLKPLGLILTNGMIVTIELPKNWHNFYHPGTRRLYRSVPPDANDVEIYVHYIGIPVGIKNTPKFKELILNRPRELTAKEVEWFDQLLNEQSVDAVKLTSAKTMKINGLQVLVVKGHSTDADDKTTKFERVYADIDATFNFIQEIGFNGKAELFEKYLPDAERTFKSIGWIATQNPDDFTKQK